MRDSRDSVNYHCMWLSEADFVYFVTQMQWLQALMRLIVLTLPCSSEPSHHH